MQDTFEIPHICIKQAAAGCWYEFPKKHITEWLGTVANKVNGWSPGR